MNSDQVQAIIEKYQTNFGAFAIREEHESLWRKWLSMQDDISVCSRAVDELVKDWNGKGYAVPALALMKKAVARLAKPKRFARVETVPSEELRRDAELSRQAMEFILSHEDVKAGFVKYLEGCPMSQYLLKKWRTGEYLKSIQAFAVEYVAFLKKRREAV